MKSAKIRYTSTVDELCEKHKNLEKELNGLKDSKKKANDDLNKSAKKIIKEYQKTINRYLDKIQAGFRISDKKANLAGGQENVNYCIDINGRAIKLGDEKTPRSQHYFGNTLSAGDKRSLAFAFFLARLDRDKNLNTKIIVLDDPISSLDEPRRWWTRDEIIRICGRSKQVFVLSHNADFLHMLWTIPEVESKSFIVQREEKECSSLAVLDIEKATRNLYYKRYDTLSAYIAGRPSDDRVSVASNIRPLLEENLRMRFPEEFDPKGSLGQYLEKIRMANPGDFLYVLKPDFDELDQINKFTLVQNRFFLDSGLRAEPT